jgi:hypothetical protein
LYDQENCSDYMVEFLNFIKDGLLRMNPHNRVACDVIVSQLQELHDCCVKDKLYSIRRSGNIPVRHGTELSLLEASPIKVSAQEDKRRSRLINSIPVHTGPVEADLPAKDREYARHGPGDDASEEHPTHAFQSKEQEHKAQGSIVTTTDLDPVVPAASLYDQNITETPTSSNFGPDVHSRPQSPSPKAHAKEGHSRPQSPASRRVHFNRNRGMSISEEYENDGETGIDTKESGQRSPSIFSSPNFDQTFPNNAWPTDSDPTGISSDGQTRSGQSDSPPDTRVNWTRQAGGQSVELDLNNATKTDDVNDGSKAEPRNQDTAHFDGASKGNNAIKNDQTPGIPPQTQPQHNINEQNGHNGHDENKSETPNSQQEIDAETPITSPRTRSEHLRSLLKAILCCFRSDK